MSTKENLRAANEADVKQAFAFTDEVVDNYPARITGTFTGRIEMFDADRLKTAVAKDPHRRRGA